MKEERLALLSGIYPLADDDPRWRHRPGALVEAALAGGASAIQLRLKHTPDGESLELARWAVERAHRAGALLIVNDRFDLADLAGADGVHLGEEDLAPERIPDPLRERLLIGLSTHSLDAVRQSHERPVDYLGFGPVYGTHSKESPYSPRGLEQLGEAVALAGRPLVAIGGISLATIEAIASAGAAAAAVISAIADAADPAQATSALGVAFRAGRAEAAR